MRSRLLRWVSARRATGDRRQAERAILALTGVGVLALVLYFLQSDLPAALGGGPLVAESPKLSGVLAALWPLSMAASVVSLFLVELAYAQMARAPEIEVSRLREALWTGLGLTFALTVVFCACYVASERDVKWDLSYFRTAKPATGKPAPVREAPPLQAVPAIGIAKPAVLQRIQIDK